MEYTIEIATSNYASTASAIKGGAHRIELCGALSEGGLTPSHGYLTRCRQDFSATALFPIIRPRGGDFLYTDEEFDIIKKDIQFCKQLEFDGIVTGFLNEDGTINKERIEQIVEIAFPMQVTFHRAFDRAKNPLDALENIIQAGCNRILTSGQKLTAEEGVRLIQDLVIAAGNRISIMPGSRVRKENIAALARQTGAKEFHSSLRATSKSKMKFIHPAFENEQGEYENDTVEPQEVEALFKALE